MKRHSLAVLALAAGATMALAGATTSGAGSSRPGFSASSLSAGFSATSSAASRVALRGLSLDMARRQVIVAAKVALRQGALEFLLCKEGTKDYESVLTTKAEPSNVHAALLALGLSPGKPGRWVKSDGDPARFVAPAGALVDVAIRWKGKAGEVEVPAWKLLKPNRVGEEPRPIKWVFVGSQMTDAGRYLADVDGTLVSVANFASATLDVPFASTDQNAMLEFSSNTELLPEQGSDVEVVLTPEPQAASAPAARMFVFVDRLGRIEADGKKVSPLALEEEARRFLSVHAQGSAEVRIDAEAMVYDRQRVQEALRSAGMEDVDVRVANASAQPPPRTPEEAQQALTQWREQLAEGESLGDPAGEALAIVKALQRRQEELRRQSELWQQYAASLQKLAGERAASQPASQATSQPARAATQPAE